MTTANAPEVEVTLDSIREISDQFDAAFGYVRAVAEMPSAAFRIAMRSAGIVIFDDPVLPTVDALEAEDRRRRIMGWYASVGAPRGLLSGWHMP